MDKIAREKLESNIADALGAESYDAVVHADDEELSEMVTKAKKNNRHGRKKHQTYTNNPYILTGHIRANTGRKVK